MLWTLATWLQCHAQNPATRSMSDSTRDGQDRTIMLLNKPKWEMPINVLQTRQAIKIKAATKAIMIKNALLLW
jgi:hypothetical protein